MRGALLLRVGLLLLAGAGPASAGAWPREQGKTFLSLSQVFTTEVETLIAPGQMVTSYSSLYAEYGLTEKLTIGLDAGYGAGPDSGVSTGVAFARYPVWESTGGQRVALDFGVGWRSDAEQGQDLRLRPGIAWGMGFDSRWGQGWLGIEASANFLVPSGQQIYKADFTAGIKPNDQWMLIGQIQTGRYPGTEALIRIAPSVVRAITPSTHLQLGVEGTVLGDDLIGAKLALWLEF